MTTSTNQQPALKTNIGAIQCTVWENTTQDGKIRYSTEIIRVYKDNNDNWQKSSSFNHDELLNVAKLAERAESFIARAKQG